MKAIRIHQFGDPGVLKLEDVPDPTPGPGQVLIRIHAVGVNPVDTYIRSGIYGQRQFPFTPGFDAAGEVEAVGPDVSQFKPNQRVYTFGSLSGAYAQKALCAVEQVYRLPDATTFEQGAALGIPYGTAWRALFQRGEALPGDVVLVHGASGGVGTACIQVARAAGMTVIGTAGSDRGRKLVREQGAHHVLDHSSTGYLDELMKLTGGRGVDVILEMLANANLAKDLTVLAKRGRVVIIGSRGPVEIMPRETMSREADIRGMLLFLASPREMTAIHAGIHAGLENNTLRPIIGTKLPLADAARAHEQVMAPGAFGKIVLLP